METKAKIIPIENYLGKRVLTQEEIKNHEDKIKAAFDRLAYNMKLLEKYGLKK
jgi:hypothetical protein